MFPIFDMNKAVMRGSVEIGSGRMLFNIKYQLVNLVEREKTNNYLRPKGQESIREVCACHGHPDRSPLPLLWNYWPLNIDRSPHYKRICVNLLDISDEQSSDRSVKPRTIFPIRESYDVYHYFHTPLLSGRQIPVSSFSLIDEIRYTQVLLSIYLGRSLWTLNIGFQSTYHKMLYEINILCICINVETISWFLRIMNVIILNM